MSTNAVASLGDLRMFVDGKWIESETGETLEATSPSTGRRIGTVPAGSG